MKASGGWTIGMLSLLAMTGSALAVNHAEFISGPFASGPEVTRKCLECHSKQGADFMKTVHWTWSAPQKVKGRGTKDLGKKNAINNFCIALPANYPRCTSCHAGYGWKDKTFDFSKAENIDCLVCHDTTGTYKKTPTGAGMPDPKVDLTAVAQSVGKTSRKSCGACHFFGGGGDHIKHGDLDSSLTNPTKEMDVHMGGQGMVCGSCHQGKNHVIPGKALSVSTSGRTLDCSDCHGAEPHGANKVLNRHGKKVACQTCHIPTFARTLPTKVWWDWSTAGKDMEDPPIDQYDQDLYSKQKGDFRWAKDVVPTYRWFNGTVDRYFGGDRIANPSKVLHLNYPRGTRKDPKAKITPFKLMEGKQPYDTVNRYLVYPQVFGGYWKHFDWNKAITDGMADAGLPYSGKYGFVQTDMYWKVNHMVVPKAEALKCDDCHGAKGRMDWKALGYRKDPRGAKK